MEYGSVRNHYSSIAAYQLAALFLPLAHGEAVAAEIPKAAFLTLDGVGHELPPEVWDKTINAISHVLNQTKAQNIFCAYDK